MRVKIYQIDFERDKERTKFLSMEGLEKFTGSSKVNPDIYQEVFSGELDPMGLEEIYLSSLRFANSPSTMPRRAICCIRF